MFFALPAPSSSSAGGSGLLAKASGERSRGLGQTGSGWGGRCLFISRWHGDFQNQIVIDEQYDAGGNNVTCNMTLMGMNNVILICGLGGVNEMHRTDRTVDGEGLRSSVR